MCHIRNVPERSGRDTVSVSQTLMIVIFYDIIITWMTICFDNKCCFHTNTMLTYNISFKFDCINQYWNSSCLFFCKFKINYYLKPHTFARIFTMVAKDVPFYCSFNLFLLLIFFIAQNRIFSLDCLPMQNLNIIGYHT